MTRIIVPLDGSTTGRSAVRPAYAVAERCGAGVLLLHVATRGSDRFDGGEILDGELERIAERFADTAPTEVATVSGQPADEILAATEPGSLVCLASHGRSGLTRVVLGSVADDVVRRSAAPVVVVGPHSTTVPLHSEKAHLVVCTDGSIDAESVIPDAGRLISLLDLSCDVVIATPPDENISLNPLAAPERIHRQAHDAAQHAADTIRTERVEPGVWLLTGDPAGAVTEHARRTDAALIALATHGRTGLMRATLGSVASTIVRHSPCPVLLVPSTRR